MTIKLHGHAELSQYGILSLFVTQYIFSYTRVTQSMYFVQYRYKGKKG